MHLYQSYSFYNWYSVKFNFGSKTHKNILVLSPDISRYYQMTLSEILSKKIVSIAYFMFELTQIEWDTSSKLGAVVKI